MQMVLTSFNWQKGWLWQTFSWTLKTSAVVQSDKVKRVKQKWEELLPCRPAWACEFLGAKGLQVTCVWQTTAQGVSGLPLAAEPVWPSTGRPAEACNLDSMYGTTVHRLPVCFVQWRLGGRALPIRLVAGVFASPAARLA